MDSDRGSAEKPHDEDKQDQNEDTQSAEETEITSLRSYDQLRIYFSKHVTNDTQLSVLRVPQQLNDSYNYLKNLLVAPANFFEYSKQHSVDPFVQQTQKHSGLLSETNSALYFRTNPTFARPFWPFRGWCSSHFLKKESDQEYFEFPKFSEFKDSPQSILPSVFDFEIRNIRSTNFDYFVHSLLKESMIRDSEENTQIQKMVETIMTDAFDDLSRRYKMFRNYSLLKMGSMYEETKVGIPDEFDFMIEIPELQDQSIVELVEDDYRKHVKITRESFTYQDSEIRDLKINNREYFRDILESTDDKNEKSFVRSLWREIHNQVAESLKSVLPQGWTWLDLTTGFDTLALTQSLLWEGKEFPKLIINIDICLSVPINTVGEEQPIQHAIIRSDGTLRYTYAVKEIGIWKKFARDDGRKVVYRLTKVILSSFLTKTYNDELFRLDSCVPSYWIKTIMFYLFEEYQDESYWMKQEISLRVLEVMLLLEKCLDCKELSSYFVPHNILKRFAWQDKVVDFHTILQNVTDLNKLFLEGCLDEERKTLLKLSELRSMLIIKNQKCSEDGLLKSLIEICYLYAHNDYQKSTMENISSFVSLFLHNTVELRGEGKELQIYHRGRKIDINKLIKETYEDDAEYFEY